MKVLTEFETMRQVADGGLSMARAGRCELRLMQGHDALAQNANRELRRQLRRLLHRSVPGLMVCVPRIFAGMPPGKDRWYREFLEHPELFRDLTYGSTFVSRSDAWVGMEDEAGYWDLVRGIWRDRPVLLVHGSEKGLAARSFLDTARSTQVLQSLARDAWVDRTRLLGECLRWAEGNRDPLVYLSLGATAAVLAHDLTMLGIQALDMGHMAQSWMHVGKQAA